MADILRTDRFLKWFDGLRDDVARGKIADRIDRLGEGNPGDCRPVGSGVSEMRIHHGPGYRVYFTRRGSRLIVLLMGGDKSTQDKDIRAAHKIAAELE